MTSEKRPPNARGQGRKALSPGEETVNISIRVPASVRAKYLQLGGAPWFRDAVHKAPLPKPSLTREDAMRMPEFAEGQAAKRAGAEIIECPYSMPSVQAHTPRILMGSEWREAYENRQQAWLFGYLADAAT